MRFGILIPALLVFSSCWKPGGDYIDRPNVKVWGSKPVYVSPGSAKIIRYVAQKQPLIKAGNIYAFNKFIFQVDVGRGIHVINNAEPSKADRIGFITVNGCQQISIKGNYLYTNSFADLLTLDISDPSNLKEISRVPRAFPEMEFNYPLSAPEEAGYFICPRYDSIVVGWVKDSIYTSCYKN